jgi:hypothetical protein
MVHFPGLARTRLCIQRAVYWFYQYGFPHSDIPGSKPVCGSPKLFAAYHVLHRLLAPRHPPYALSSLTIKLTQHASTVSGKGPEKFVTQSLASPRPLIDQGVTRLCSKSEQNRATFRKGKFAFPQTLLSSKTCGLLHVA